MLFENAYSNANWTLPSSVSMFTGEYPTAWARVGEDVSHKHDFYYVDDGASLLAEALAERGYETARFVENRLAEKPNTFQGFSERSSKDASIERERVDIERRIGAELNEPRRRRILRFLHYLLRENRGPFFAVQWIMDPHAAYDPPPSTEVELDIAPSGLPHPLHYYRALGSRTDAREGLPRLAERVGAMTEAEVDLLVSLYGLEIESVDQRVGFVLEGLAQSGHTEDTIVVFTSDHGEGFGEHGRFFHGGGRWLYEEFVRVPLILRGPGVVSGRRVSDVVSHVDLMPTLCDLMRVRCLPEAQGVSLGDALRAAEPPVGRERPAYLVGTTRRGEFDALRDGRFKLIATPDRTELYDLADDPRERNDLSLQRPEVVKRMLSELVALRAATRARREARGGVTHPDALRRASRETLDALRSLGYLESP